MQFVIKFHSKSVVICVSCVFIEQIELDNLTNEQDEQVQLLVSCTTLLLIVRRLRSQKGYWFISSTAGHSLKDHSWSSVFSSASLFKFLVPEKQTYSHNIVEHVWSTME